MAIFGGYTGARVAPLPSGFMGAAMTSASNLQKGLASMGEGIGDALKQYGKNKDERDLLEGDIDAIKQIVESDPMRYIDVARDETNIKKFSEVPDMSLSKLRAYSTSLRTQMAAVDRRDAQSIQDLQRQGLQAKADDRANYAAAMANRPDLTDPVMQTQYGTKTVLPIPEGRARELGEEAAWDYTGFQEKVLDKEAGGFRVPIVSQGQDTASPKDVREFYKGMATEGSKGLSSAIGKFGAGVGRLFDPAVGMGKSLGALAQVPGAPALEGYFQPEYEGIRATGPGGAPTPEDIARLDYNRSEIPRLLKLGYKPHEIAEMGLHPAKVEETPLYVPREKGDAPGSMIQKDGINTRTGLPDLTRYAGETSDLRIPGDTSKAPTGYWTGLAQDGKMPDDAYTITADGKKTMMQMMSLEDTKGWSSVERLLELNPHIRTWYDDQGRVQPGNKEGDWVPPAGTKILIPNETPEKDAAGKPINVSRYRDPEAVAADVAKGRSFMERVASNARDLVGKQQPLAPHLDASNPDAYKTNKTFKKHFGHLDDAGQRAKWREVYEQYTLGGVPPSLEAEMTAPPTFPFEQRQTSETVKVGDRDVTWKDAHARMIQSLVDDGQQITPALSKSLEDYARTQYAAEEVGITVEPVQGTDDVLVYNNGKYIGKSTKSESNEIVVRPVGDSGISVVTQGGRIYQVLKPSGASSLNEFQGKAFLNLSRMQSSQTEIERITKGFDPTSSWQRLKIILPREMEPAKWEEYQAAMYEWTDAMLRQTTGAQATEAEIERNILTYFPQPGQGEGKKEQSARMRVNVMDTISRMLPPEYQGAGTSRAGVGTNRNYTTEEINDPRAKKKK